MYIKFLSDSLKGPENLQKTSIGRRVKLKRILNQDVDYFHLAPVGHILKR
jgi:hypothetical protein